MAATKMPMKNPSVEQCGQAEAKRQQACRRHSKGQGEEGVLDGGTLERRADETQGEVAQAPGSGQNQGRKSEEVGPLGEVAPGGRPEFRNGQQVGKTEQDQKSPDSGCWEA